MGTRSEIYIRNSNECIGLWKHWDGYPDYMIPMFKEFLEYAYNEWKEAPHWLTYPEDLAGLLISWYHKKLREELKKIREDTPVNTDIRPFIDVTGEKLIEDAEYIWIINTPENNHVPLRYEILGYKLRNFNGLTKEEIIQVKEKGRIKSPNAKLVVREVVELETPKEKEWVFTIAK